MRAAPVEPDRARTDRHVFQSTCLTAPFAALVVIAA